MTPFEKQIKKYTEKIKLSSFEKDEMRERVRSYMEYHPNKLKQESFSYSVRGERIISEAYRVIRVSLTPAHVRAGAFVAVFFIMIIPFMAEQSVPGDVLYLVKTNFTEPIQKQLASSPYEKIEFETKLMERRITEARSLADEGKLTEEVKSQIVETVKGHSSVVQKELAELRESDVESAALAEIGFNASLEVQTAVLADTVSDDDTTSNAGMILDAVNQAREEVASQQTATPSYEGLIAHVETETTRAYELFESIKTTATEEEKSDIDRRLNDINRLVDEAKKEHETDVDFANENLATTLGLIQKLITFMADINVRASVALETIVPIVLSDIERTDIVREEVRIVTALHIDIEKRIPLLEEGIREKTEEGYTKVAELLLRTTTALDISDIETAEASIREAKVFVSDLILLTNPSVEEIQVPIENTENGSTTESILENNENATSSISIEGSATTSDEVII